MAEQVKCLGRTFSNEDERREYFRNELRRLLPELKKIDGYPIGEDENIIALSDPPYFTACPNPWLNDFINEWEKEKENLKGRQPNFIVNEPFASDISEGKEHLIYKAHSYHTKVPHAAIMKYLLHYTQSGDIIFDGFAGTGMTGVAANQCYHPEIDIKSRFERESKASFDYKSINWGKRNCICSDLSPIASFIAYNFNIPLEQEYFEFAEKTLKLLEEEYKWIYNTNHQKDRVGKINFIVWSQVFSCPSCNCEIVFFDVTTNPEDGEMLDEFKCPSCSLNLSKNKLIKVYESVYDYPSSKVIQTIKYVPSLISYNFGNKRYFKKPDEDDLLTINRIKTELSKLEIPIYEIPKGDKTSEAINAGIVYHHQFYFDRSLLVLKLFSNKIKESRKFINISSTAAVLSKLYRLTSQGGSFGAGGGPMNGVIYFPSVIKELPAFKVLKEHLLKTYKVKKLINESKGLISTQSMTDFTNLSDNSIDYIFTDPPFGSNLMYSELNFLRESWIKLFTETKTEAIENKTQGKSALDYQDLMTGCFKEYFRILKPSKWMTVEFSNTSAAIWNGIQTAIQRAGFIISNVAALDKKQGSFNAVTNPTSVKQDLIISCYKPSKELGDIFHKSTDISIWQFVSEHLKHLPIHLIIDKNTTLVIERNAKILYDRLISYYLIHGLSVPIDAKEFQEGLKLRFIERDGMYFTDNQVAEYEERKAKVPNVIQITWQVATESEGIEWLKRELKDRPLKYQDIQPKWMQAITAVRKGDILPELRDLLQQNFIEKSDGSWRVPDMNEANDRETLRNKVLLREFNAYIEIANNPKAKKMKEVRVEALRAGFKSCWERKDFLTIVKLSEKIPQNLLLEDEQLLMYYDIAKDRV